MITIIIAIFEKGGAAPMALHPPVDVTLLHQALLPQGLPHGPSPHFAKFTTADLITAGFSYFILLPPIYLFVSLCRGCTFTYKLIFYCKSFENSRAYRPLSDFLV